MFKLILYFFILFFSASSFSDVVIIVNKNNSSVVSKDLVKKIYLGMAVKFEDGSRAEAINVSDNKALRDDFNKTYIGKSQNQITAYWARLAYSGRAYNLKEVTAKEAVEQVSTNDAAIGYVDRSMITDGVKVVE